MAQQDPSDCIESLEELVNVVGINGNTREVDGIRNVIIKPCFEALSDPETGTIDVTELKHLMVAVGANERAPQFFKVVAEASARSNAEGQWSLEEFEKQLFRTAEHQRDMATPILSLEDMVSLFEMLDRDRDTLITEKDLFDCL